MNESLLNPRSIVVVGGSNDTKKPGGKLLKNLTDGAFKGQLYVVNPNERMIQGIDCILKVDDLPAVDLAILAIPAAACVNAVSVLVNQKSTKAFIIISAGFGEADEHGKKLEAEIAAIVNKAGASLIGPNCIGVINPNYHGVFTSPIPPLHAQGCDLISGSGATAVFIMEAGIPLGIKFANVFSVGNAAQTSAEDVLEYMDLHFDAKKDAPIKLLYLETISNPQKLLKHASSLIRKGCTIAAIKAGSTEAGVRAAASHTGAIANSDITVRALFRKAGIVYCSSREELLSVASIFHYKKLSGKNIAIITHAGGSAVMLTDALSAGGLNVPAIEGPEAKKLLTHLYPGSSVSNPIDFLATGTAEQLGIIIDYCEQKFNHIDAMAVVFGSPGLFDVEHVYNVLSTKMDVCKKPIFPVLPSVINAQREIKHFLNKGHINFPDEVVLGRALCEVYKTPQPKEENTVLPEIDENKIRQIIDSASNGFMHSDAVKQILDAASVPRVAEIVVSSKDEALQKSAEIGFPMVMKVVGPVHKTDVGGVVLNVSTEAGVKHHFKKLIKIEGATGVLLQPMARGMELFIGVKKEPGFGHLVLCGLGGIFIEVLKDVQAGLAPISNAEAIDMIERLNGYKLLEGYRGKEGVDISVFAEIIQRVAALTLAAPEISEMDINPLIGNSIGILAVDTRILIQH